MKYFNLSSKNRPSPHWTKFALVGVVAAALAGCGGGSDGTNGTNGANGANGANGTNGKDLTTQVSFASNTTAATPAAAAAWMALAPSISNVTVTVNSPPVVNFTVKDAAGLPVTGLAAYSQATSASVKKLVNVAFTLAKFVPAASNEPSKWVSMLVVRPPTKAELTAVPATSSCVAATATEKMWCGTFPTSDAEGTLVDNGGGSYTYTFYRDVKKTAAIVASLTDSVDGLSKKADLGDVSWNAAGTYRLGIQIGGAAPGTGSNLVDATTLAPVSGAPTSVSMVNAGNAWVDFRSDGAAVPATREVVKIEACATCHDGKVLAHGSRKDPNYCVTCHTDQIKYSFNAGNAPASANGLTLLGNTTAGATSAQKRAAYAILDGRAVGNYPNMVHKIHMGAELVKQGYNFNNAGGAMNFNEVGLPQSPANCTTCHNGTANGVAKAPAQGDNWKNVPSMLACGACHDGINFATGGGVTLADRDKDVAAGVAVGTTQTGHIGGAKADNATCVLCHTTADVTAYHQLTVASRNNPVVKAGISTFEYKISGVTINASRQLVVKFQVLKNGTTVALNAYAAGAVPITGFTGGPAFVVAYATGQDGIAAPSDWNSGHSSAKLADVWAGSFGNTLSAPDATNTYTAVIAASSATVPLAVPADAKMVTALLAGTFIDAKANVLPGVPAMMAATGNTPDGKANVARRVIFKEGKCNSCHDRLGTSPNFHSGSYSIAMCAACHTPNQGGSTGWSASFRVWVHGIHSAEKRTVPFTWHAVSATDNYSTLGYPGVLKDCKQCHEAGTYDFSASQYTDALVGGMLNVTAASGAKVLASSYVPPQAAPVGSAATSGLLAYGLNSAQDYGVGNSIVGATGVLIAQTTQGTNLVSSPITATCSACHDSASAIAHYASNNGSFYQPRSIAVTKTEACLVCHGPGKIAAIADVHSN